jgi:hypothetical protein
VSANDTTLGPPIAEVLARLANALDAAIARRPVDPADISPALKTLTAADAAIRDARSERKRKFVALVMQLRSEGRTPGEIKEAAQERLGISKNPYYRLLNEAIESGVIPDDSRKSGTEREP